MKFRTDFQTYWWRALRKELSLCSQLPAPSLQWGCSKFSGSCISGYQRGISLTSDGAFSDELHKCSPIPEHKQLFPKRAISYSVSLWSEVAVSSAPISTLFGQHFVSDLLRWKMLIKAGDDTKVQSVDDVGNRSNSRKTAASQNDGHKQQDGAGVVA